MSLMQYGEPVFFKYEPLGMIDVCLFQEQLRIIQEFALYDL